MEALRWDCQNLLDFGMISARTEAAIAVPPASRGTKKDVQKADALGS